MTKSFLNTVQRQIVETIEIKRFGSIESLFVRNGLPQAEPEPRIVQTIKLDTPVEPLVTRSCDDLTLQSEFDSLFQQLNQLGDGVVDIEFRHGRPFMLAVERSRKGLL